MYKSILIILTLLSFSLIAQASDTDVNWETNFKPYMVNHINEGCPSNSECTPLLGKKRKAWEDLFKNRPNEKNINSFVKENGFPLKIWSTPKKDDEHIISWNSPCEIHNKENHLKRTGEIFLKSPLKNLSNAYVHKIFIKANNKIQEYIIPRDETPLYKNGDNLIFLLEEKGHYFGMTINHRKEFSFIRTPSTDNFSELVTCPKDLLDYFDKHVTKDLYLFSNCKALWNSKTKKFETFIVGKACS